MMSGAMVLSSELHPTILNALSVTDYSNIEVVKHGASHFGETAKLVIHGSTNENTTYFLKILSNELSALTCRGEFEALRIIHSTCGHVPQPYRWGSYTEKGTEKSFLIVEFLDIVRQPAEPCPLAMALADLHQKSDSPTGRFGFHIPTVHTGNVQAVAFWTDSWCELFASHFSHILSLAATGLQWPEFDRLGKLTLEKIIPRLLLPLQSDGRSIKPSLVHGDCWDGNTAMTKDGKAVFFDVASFYGHNEYDLGDWRAPRHALSDPAYINEYKKIIPPSEPIEDWDDRNLLYSLTWNICNALFIPGSTQRPIIYEDMMTLCKRICPDEL